MKTLQKRTEEATKEKKKMGQNLTNLIIKLLEKQSQGATIYELTELFKHEVKSPGTIKSAIDRLQDEGKVEHKEFKQDGRKIIQYNLKPLKPVGYVEISKDELDDSWKNNAIAYGADLETIVISPNENPQYKGRRSFKISISEKENLLKFLLPEEFIDFYQLRERGIDVQTNQKEIIINVGKKSSVPKPPKKFRILIADDAPEDEVIKRIIKKLDSYSHKVEIAKDSTKLEALLSRHKYDFLIFDMTMQATDQNPDKLLKIIQNFYKNNKNSFSLIITTQAYGKPQINSYIKKGFSWLYDKDTPNIEEKIHTRMIRLWH